MHKRSWSIVIICAVLAVHTLGQATLDARAEAARQAAVKIGTGPKAKVEVRLRDSSRLKGYIDSADADSFSLVDEKSGSSREISFAEVDQLKKRPGGIGKGGWIAIIAGAAGASIITGVLLNICHNELGCGAGQ